jgi:hypothetical protein
VTSCRQLHQVAHYQQLFPGRGPLVSSLKAGSCCRLVTGPLHTIALSMQLSVIPHLTAYGDVKPEQLKQTMIGSATKKMKLLAGKEAKELAVAKAEKPLTNYEQ